MTYSQKKTLQTLINICAKNTITGITVTEQNGEFTVTRNGKTELESVSYDQCYAYLEKAADMLNTATGTLHKEKGREMSKKLKKKFG